MYACMSLGHTDHGLDVTHCDGDAAGGLSVHKQHKRSSMKSKVKKKKNNSFYELYKTVKKKIICEQKTRFNYNVRM